MKWYSSDFHLGHANIAGPKTSKWAGGYRDFDSVEQMDRTIINTVNKYVKENDTLYFMGDFCFGGHHKTPGYAKAFICQNIHACIGNHDGNIERYSPFFSSIRDTQRTSEGKYNIFMSHYAHRVWYGSHKGFIHLYGHSHGSIEDHGKSMDVGIDVAYKMFGEYRPFSMDEIIEIMDKKEIAFVDDHGSETNVK